jgi:hypothetical protein
VFDRLLSKISRRARRRDAQLLGRAWRVSSALSNASRRGRGSVRLIVTRCISDTLSSQCPIIRHKMRFIFRFLVCIIGLIKAEDNQSVQNNGHPTGRKLSSS